ncbi:MAG: hypothetical protein QOC71_445 [Thermoplasmata archaeon]|jgi:hypothetical protein|nr:hypothetical protein [Thermoplasmata archaeon]
MLKFTRKRAAVLGAVATIAIAGGAYAYWTTTGDGTGTGSTKATNGVLVLHGTVDDQLAPGESSTVHFTADNASTTDLRIRTIHLDGITSDDPNCRMSDFTMPDVASNQTIVHGTTGAAVTATGTLSYANDPAFNQDDCKDVTLTLDLSSN